MNKLRGDLHIHTTASDGINTPEQIIDLAAISSLSFISFTDHDCVDAYSGSVFSYAEEKGIRLITGMELSCRKKGKDVHILGYFIDVKNQILQNTLADLKTSRILRCQKMLDKLRAHQIYIDYDEAAALAQGSIGRVHIAQIMIMKRYVSNIKEAFELYLSDGCDCYVEREGLSVEDAIGLINECGGISVLAHPKLIGNDEIVNEVIAAGIQGLEAYHNKHTFRDKTLYAKLANENGLFITGGSDFHGRHTNDALGSYIINERFLEIQNINNKSDRNIYS